MNHNIAISVVIPTFNREKTIKKCLDSVLSQTFSPIEVIVVDDCSNDKTKEIINNYSDERLRYTALSRKNGAQAARNRGIKEANGNWIAFQDSDDTWVESKLARQIKALSKVDFDPLTVVYTNAMQVDVATGTKHLKPNMQIDGKNAYKSLLSKFGPMYQGMMVSKAALKRIDYLDENVPAWQEWDTSIRLAKYCRFLYVDEPLFIYYRHQTGTISSDRRKDVIGYQYVINKFEKDIKRICGKETWDNHLIYLIKSCLDLQEWKDAVSKFKQIYFKNAAIVIIFKYILIKIFHRLH